MQVSEIVHGKIPETVLAVVARVLAVITVSKVVVRNMVSPYATNIV